MGAWSPKAFGNDSALDMALDLNASENLRAFKARLELAVDTYEQYDARRDRGENKEIWSEKHVQEILSQIEPPVDPDIESVLRNGIGEEHLDSGSDPAFGAIAAGAITLAACRKDTATLQDEVHSPFLGKFRPTSRMVEKIVRVLRLIPKNKELCRDCGPAWKKGVLRLTDELAACGAKLSER